MESSINLGTTKSPGKVIGEGATQLQQKHWHFRYQVLRGGHQERQSDEWSLNFRRQFVCAAEEGGARKATPPYALERAQNIIEYFPDIGYWATQDSVGVWFCFDLIVTVCPGSSSFEILNFVEAPKFRDVKRFNLQ